MKAARTTGAWIFTGGTNTGQIIVGFEWQLSLVQRNVSTQKAAPSANRNEAVVKHEVTKLHSKIYLKGRKS